MANTHVHKFHDAAALTGSEPNYGTVYTGSGRFTHLALQAVVADLSEGASVKIEIEEQISGLGYAKTAELDPIAEDGAALLPVFELSGTNTRIKTVITPEGGTATVSVKGAFRSSES